MLRLYPRCIKTGEKRDFQVSKDDNVDFIAKEIDQVVNLWLLLCFLIGLSALEGNFYCIFEALNAKNELKGNPGTGALWNQMQPSALMAFGSLAVRSVQSDRAVLVVHASGAAPLTRALQLLRLWKPRTILVELTTAHAGWGREEVKKR